MIIRYVKGVYMKSTKQLTPEKRLELAKLWIRDGDWRVRQAALELVKVCADIPATEVLELAKLGIRDGDSDVRQAALELYQAHEIEIPTIRTSEPPHTVYKKCLLGVIVCATIPDDAQVRGSEGAKCRTNKAAITKVIGDVCGEPVGISWHDKRTLYYEGDEIEIEDFDYSNTECSTGFHFFYTLQEAKNYNFT